MKLYYRRQLYRLLQNYSCNDIATVPKQFLSCVLCVLLFNKDQCVITCALTFNLIFAVPFLDTQVFLCSVTVVLTWSPALTLPLKMMDKAFV